MSLSVTLAHAFDGFTLDVDFAVPPGLTVLFGRSGSGKTSVVQALAGVMRPEAGRAQVGDGVLFDVAQGIWLPPHKRRVGTVFQDARLFPHMSVARNLRYGLRFAPKGASGPEFDAVVEMLGLGHLLDRRPAALSGGEAQRVALGRALLAKPKLILADEPLSALDAERKSEILPYFERLRDEAEVPVLYVTHAAAEVARLATTVVVLDQGRVVRQGAAHEVLADPWVRPTSVREVGAVLNARVLRHHADGLTELDAGGIALFLPHVDRPEGSSIRVRIPGQDVLLSRFEPKGLSALNILPGRVTELREGEGPGAVVALDTAAGPILARVTRRSVKALGLAQGVECHAIVKTLSIAPEDVGG